MRICFSCLGRIISQLHTYTLPFRLILAHLPFTEIQTYNGENPFFALPNFSQNKILKEWEDFIRLRFLK